MQNKFLQFISLVNHLSSYINGVIESSIQNNQSVSSTIQQLMREQNEEGMTQTVPIIKNKE